MTGILLWKPHHSFPGARHTGGELDNGIYISIIEFNDHRNCYEISLGYCGLGEHIFRIDKKESLLLETVDSINRIPRDYMNIFETFVQEVEEIPGVGTSTTEIGGLARAYLRIWDEYIFPFLKKED